MKKQNLISVAVLGLLISCATPAKMPLKDVAELKPKEGRVIGSVLLNVPVAKDTSSWAWLNGRKAESFTYSLTIQEPSVVPNPFARRYAVVAAIGKEETFVMKLPAGVYEFTEMKQRGFSSLTSYVGRQFAVAPGATTYIGRLVIEFPERLAAGTAFRVSVDDIQDQTLTSVKDQYAGAVTDVVKSLMK